MIKPVVRDVIFLGQKSSDATPEDVPTADDLMHTLKANAEKCVGMAANMIGVKKRVIVFNDDGNYVEMFNPEILRASEPFEAEEGCLSLDGTRRVKRYRSVKVKWQTRDFRPRIRTFTGWSAQIIQHEIDHCNGILI